MPHHSAFVITSLTLKDLEDNRETTLRQLAREAGFDAAALTSTMDHANARDPKPETLAIGGNQHRFIKGEQRTNAECLTKDQMAAESTFQFWSDSKGRHADPGDAPAQILENSWNTAAELLTLALKTGQSKRPIFPQALIEPNGALSHHLTFPETDVFGDRVTGKTAAMYLEEPASAHFMAMNPLREIAQANFRAEYVRKLHRWKDHLVVELDWNL